MQCVLEVQSLPGALPAQLVRPADGRLRVFLDVASAQKLHIDSWADAKQFPRSS
jgi:6-phosphogluconolactonase